jgi:hypothetical protein
MSFASAPCALLALFFFTKATNAAGMYLIIPPPWIEVIPLRFF